MNPPSSQVPTVHFRQPGHIAHILYLDGHVSALTQGTRNPPSIHDTSAMIQLRDDERIFDLGSTDEFWDRE